MLTFTKNKKLNKDFEIKAAYDQVVITPEGYQGPITGIPDREIILGMIRRGSNLVTYKISAAATSGTSENA